MTRCITSSSWRRLASASILACVAGCGSLLSTTPPPTFYSLDAGQKPTPQAASAGAPTLVVSVPRAAAGFDSARIIYVRDAYRLEYFARSEWIDTPARMLAPLIVAAIQSSSAFRAVAPTSSAARGEFRLDTEILRLQHDFGASPSRVRFTLRAYLIETDSNRVVAWRDLDATAVAASEDPLGGVAAANRAVQEVLEALAGFCAEAVARLPGRR